MANQNKQTNIKFNSHQFYRAISVPIVSKEESDPWLLYFVIDLFVALITCQYDPIYKWIQTKNSFVSIKISPTYLFFKLIIPENLYSQTRLLGLI